MGETSAGCVLFADVSGSTKLYETVGDDAAHQAIELCLKLFSALAAQHGGRVVKTIGDEVMVVFPDASHAGAAARDIQLGMSDMAPVGKVRLGVRIGMHQGPVVEKGGDVFGDTVNLCSRLVDIANPRQVLTTQQTVDALSPGLRKRCRTLPPTKVRGRAAEVAACEVLWRGDADVTEVSLTQEMLVKAAQWVLKLSYADATFTVEHSASVRIGRDKENDVVVPSQHASRLHARVFGRDGNFVIVDQSSNGTFVLVDGSTREIRLRREEALLGERGTIGLGSPTAGTGDHLLHYKVQRRGGAR